MRQVAMEFGMSQATRNIVCSQAAGEEMESFKTKSGKTEMRAAKRTLGKEKLQISWGKLRTNLACMRTQQQVPK